MSMAQRCLVEISFPWFFTVEISPCDIVLATVIYGFWWKGWPLGVQFCLVYFFCAIISESYQTNPFCYTLTIFAFQAYSTPKDDPGLSEQEKRLIMGGSVSKEPVTSIPWKLILSKAPVWALIISHFCHNWGTFILLTWMPTYYSQVSDTYFLE